MMNRQNYMNITVKKNMMAKFKTVLMVVAVSVGLAPAYATSVEVESPLDLLQRTSDAVIKQLKDQQASLKDSPELVYKIVDDYIVPHLDDVSMAKLALGKNWREANNEQKIEFVDQFRTLLIRTYSKSLQEFRDEKINFFPLRIDPGEQKVVVKSEVIQSGGQKIPVSYRMRLKDNAWKVYDINIDGVSLVTSYRGTFAQEVRKGGMTGLLKMLQDKNSKVIIEDPPADASADKASDSQAFAWQSAS